MADEMHDLRTKIPTETLSVIHALEIATGETGSEIARRWLVAAAANELHKANVICAVLNPKGNAVASEGNP
jgi:hypothetical protein